MNELNKDKFSIEKIDTGDIVCLLRDNHFQKPFSKRSIKAIQALAAEFMAKEPDIK